MKFRELLLSLFISLFCFIHAHAEGVSIKRTPTAEWHEMWCGSSSKDDYPSNITGSEKCEVTIRVEDYADSSGKPTGCKVTDVKPDVLHVVGKSAPLIQWSIVSSTTPSPDHRFHPKKNISFVGATEDDFDSPVDYDDDSNSIKTQHILRANNVRFAAFTYKIRIQLGIDKPSNTKKTYVDCPVVDPLVVTHG